MNKIVLFLLYFILLCCCTRESLEEPIAEYPESPNIDVSKMEQGHIRIKITEDFSVNLEQQANRQGRVVSTNVKSSDDILSSLGIEYMQRVFPPAGKFEARTRKEGLHLWYDVYFDNNTPLTRAKGDISDMEGITYVEYVPILVPIRSNLKKIIDVPAMANNTTKSTPYFNDPLFVDQWHYHNDGSRPMSIKGSDINVLPVWENYTKGKSDIIVSIVDGGIDINHEDLKGNIWINDLELNGTPGVDDDGNGYVDDINGWDFVDKSSTIVPDEHGTHIAGTVGAVSNNGIGVSGVAGGDAHKGIKGVRLMSCQIFIGDKSGSGAEAIKYGADAGAIISQNSWAYEGAQFTPDVLKEAVDYFIKYAGVDEGGKQVGPMKGGIVIFAAGNEDASVGYPAEYEKIIAVSAIGSSFKRAYYSNYGNWVDIAAPGGASDEDNYIISTLPSNKYGGMQGTSMACPHVSGVAALLISHFGGAGFTNDMLKERLLLSANDIIYNYDNPFYIGSGLLDAEASFGSFSNFAPNKIINLRHSVISNNIELEYTIPIDPDDTKLRNTIIYYSKNPFTKDIYRYNLPEEISSKEYDLFNYKVGDEFICRISNLDFVTTYYLAVDTRDLSGNMSELSDIIEINIGKNNPPEVVLNHDDLMLNFSDKQHVIDMTSYFYDIDQEELNYTIISSNQGLFSTETKDDIITFSFTKIGSSNVKIVASDNFGGAASLDFKMLIRDIEVDIDIYPNPVFNTLNFRMGENKDAVVSIYGASGSILLKREITISPFSPAQIDLSGFSAGSYTVVVDCDDKQLRRNIIKL